VRFQVRVHHAKRGVTSVMPLADQMLLLGKILLGREFKPEACDGHVWLVAILLEEHPLQCLRTIPLVFRRELRAFGEIPDDGVGFGKCASVLEFEQRHAAVRIFGKKGWLARLAGVKGILLQRDCHAELSRGEANLVAIAGHLHLMKHGHDSSLRNSTRIMHESVRITYAVCAWRLCASPAR
jgi:hypothetical protein